jgi:hypothetical protein
MAKKRVVDKPRAVEPRCVLFATAGRPGAGRLLPGSVARVPAFMTQFFGLSCSLPFSVWLRLFFLRHAPLC